MKRLVSMLLAMTLCLSLVVPAYAGNESKDLFYKAIKATFAEYSRESALINKVDRSSEMLGNLMLKYPYEGVVEIGVKSDSESLSVVNGLKMMVASKLDRFNSTSKADLSVFVPKALLDSRTDIDLAYSVFNSKDGLAINVPAIDESYYQFPSDVTMEEWNESPIGQEIPMNEDDYNTILALINSLSTASMSSTMSADLINAGTYSAIGARYTKIFTDFIGKGSYQDGGTALVETNRGMLGVKKTTVTFTEEQMQSFLDTLGEQLYTDKDLRSLLDKVYGAQGEALGMDYAEMYLTTIVSALDYIILPEWMSYSIYTNGDNKILRHEFAIPGDFGEALSLKIDTVGKTNLLDEIYITGEMDDDGDISSIKFSAVGNYVPVNGVFKTDMSLKAYQSVRTEGGTEVLQAIDIMKGNYKLDMNKTEDNFEFNIHVGRFGRETYSLANPYDFNLSMIGDYVVDIPGKEFLCDIKNIHVLYDEYEADISLSVVYRAVESSDVSVSADKLVDVTKLSEEAVADLAKKVTKFSRTFQ